MFVRILRNPVGSQIITNRRISIITKKIMGHNSKMSMTTSTNTEKTIQEMKLELIKTMGIEGGYNPILTPRTHLLQYLPTSQDELPPRSMQDSFLAALIPLSTDTALQEKYVTFLGHVRLGRLLEDMDIFAVMVAAKHINNPKSAGKPFPYTLVTALVDKIHFTDHKKKPNEDIRISGHVSWVGKSSIEVVVWLEQKAAGVWQKLTRALFLMAARDPTNSKSAIVNALVPATDEERKILAGGEARRKRRMIVQQQHVTKVIPSQEEQKLVHDIYLKSLMKEELAFDTHHVQTENVVSMDLCTLSSIVFSHPEDRNLHNTVFGGFVMRHATDLSWALGYLFSKYRPTLKTISDMSFNKPMAVSSLIQMKACIVYTQMQYCQITVHVRIRDPMSGNYSTTNTFHFTYEVPQLIPELHPKSYHEAMMYIDGRRHFFEAIKDHPSVNKM